MLNHLSSGKIMRHRTSIGSLTLWGSTSTMPRKTQVQYGYNAENMGYRNWPQNCHCTVRLSRSYRSKYFVLTESFHFQSTFFLSSFLSARIKIYILIFLAKGKHMFYATKVPKNYLLTILQPFFIRNSIKIVYFKSKLYFQYTFIEILLI